MQDILTQAEEYSRNYRIVGRAHYLTSQHVEKCNNRLGIPVVIITAIVGTAIFGTLNTDPALSLRIATGICSMAATVLASLQTFLAFSERATKHKIAGAKYRDIVRRFQVFALKYKDCDSSRRNEALGELEGLIERLSELAEEYPSIPDSHYYEAEAESKNGPE